MPKRSADLGIAGLGAPDQIGILVPRLGAIREMTSLLGVGGWAIYTYGPDNLTEQSYRGAPGRFRMRLALSATTPEIELIEPLDGPSIYHDWIAEHGHGMHHLGYLVDSIAALEPEFADRGFPVIQSGRGFGLDGDGGFAYFDTFDELGAIVELIELPSREPPGEEL